MTKYHALPVGLVTLATSLVAASCYDAKAPDPEDLAELLLPTEPLRADGITVARIDVRVDPDTPLTTDIEVTVSTGVVNLAADPKDSASRRVVLRNDRTGSLSTPWYVGTRAGEAVVALSVGGVHRWKSLPLTRSKADGVDISLDATSLVADGVSGTEAIVTLAAGNGERLVSDRTIVRFVVCCAGSDGTARACTGPLPIRAPTHLESGEGGRIASRLVTVRQLAPAVPDGGPPPPPQVVWIVADATGEPGCTWAPDRVASAVALELRPLVEK